MNPESQARTSSPDAAEPSATFATVPIWLFMVMLLLLYWGAVYFDREGGWFSASVYRPYRDLEQVVAMQPSAGPEEELIRRGKVLFTANCAVCHMESGVGNPANGCPPLDGSEWLRAPGVGRLVRFVSKGLTGPIEVKGQTWSTGAMLPIGDQLPGSEEEKDDKIAAILSYVRYVFGGKAPPVAPATVTAIRAEIKNNSGPFHVRDILQIPEEANK